MKSENISDAAIGGMGVLSCAGNGCAETLFRLFHPDPSYPALPGPRTGTGLKNPLFELARFRCPQDSELTRAMRRHCASGTECAMTRSMDLLLHALEEALLEADLSLSGLRSRRTGVCIGTTVGCQLNDLEYYAQIRNGDFSCPGPMQRYLKGNPAELLREGLFLDGPALCISNACASGSDALGIAAMWIRSGLCDLVIAGGTDALDRVPIAGFHALGVDSDEPCRPFDKHRKGLNLGEAAGVVILESAESARKRGKKPEFFLSGYGNSADAYHITRPLPDAGGLLRAFEGALRMGGICEKREIAFLNAHGTGTPANDSCEANAIHHFFGPETPYFSTKALTGHTLGAAGAVEFIFTVLLLREGRIPPSHGFFEKPEDIIRPPQTEPARIHRRFAVSDSLAFGGSNAALLAERR